MTEVIKVLGWFDLPSTILFFLLAGWAYTLWGISRGDRIYLADMFKGESGLASASRFIAIGGWIFATWALMIMVLKYARGGESVQFPNEYALGYLGICVAGYALNKGTEAWRARAGQPEEDKSGA